MLAGADGRDSALNCTRRGSPSTQTTRSRTSHISTTRSSCANSATWRRDQRTAGVSANRRELRTSARQPRTRLRRRRRHWPSRSPNGRSSPTLARSNARTHQLQADGAAEHRSRARGVGAVRAGRGRAPSSGRASPGQNRSGPALDLAAAAAVQMADAAAFRVRVAQADVGRNFADLARRLCRRPDVSTGQGVQVQQDFRRPAGTWTDRPARAAKKSGTGKRLRVGYVSSDLREHAVGFALCDVLELHDKSKVEIFAYYCGDPRSATRRTKG